MKYVKYEEAKDVIEKLNNEVEELKKKLKEDYPDESDSEEENDFESVLKSLNVCDAIPMDTLDSYFRKLEEDYEGLGEFKDTSENVAAHNFMLACRDDLDAYKRLSDRDIV